MTAVSHPRSSSRAARAVAVDARSPMVLDTRTLGRRAGSMHEVRRTLAAPAGWALPLVSVPEGSEVSLDLRLEAVMDGVLVSGTVAADLEAECGRCLEPVASTLSAPVQELFTYEPTEDGDDALVVSGDLIDLEPVLRDAVVLALPVTPLCSPDCSGLCSECGTPLAEAPAGHNHETIDPRWADLANLADSTDSDLTTPDTDNLES